MTPDTALHMQLAAGLLLVVLSILLIALQLERFDAYKRQIALSSIAIFFSAAFAVHSLMRDAVPPVWVPAWVYGFGPIVLPVLAAGFMSLVSVNDLHRRVARYREMRVRLETARKEATFVQTWGSLERVVAKAERALLQEVFEWHSITSFSESR